MFIEGYCGDTATSWVIGGHEPHPAQEKLMTAGTRIRCKLPSMRRSSAIAWATSRTRCRPSSSKLDFMWSVSTAVMASVGPCMKSRMCPCYGTPKTGIRLVEGMVLALEVMANAGTAARSKHKKRRLDRRYADRTANAESMHYERMVAITAHGHGNF